MDVTSDLSISGDHVEVSGALIAGIGSSTGDPSDPSAPGLVLMMRAGTE